MRCPLASENALMPACKLEHALFAICLCLAACQSDRGERSRNLPELPQIALDSFAEKMRAKLEAPYRAARRSAESAKACGDLGMVLHAHDQFALAEVCYRRAHALDPESFRWRYYLGTALAAQRKDALAVEVFQSALAFRPGFVPLQLALAESLSLTGDSEESERQYRAVLSRNEAVPRAHLGLANILLVRGEIGKAIEHLERACELAPEFGAARYALALAYRDAGLDRESDAQLALYEKGKSDAPAIPDPFLQDVRQLKDSALERVSRGIRLAQAGSVDDAIAEHERALELDPRMQQARSNLVQLYGRTNRLDKAEEYYRGAVASNPDQAELHYNFGVLMFENSRFGEAGAAFRRALEINPNYAEAHNNLGQVLERENRIAAAMQHYRRAVANKPNYRLAYFHLGRVQVALGLLEEAVESFEQTLKPTDEMTPTFMYGLAAALVRSGRRQDALRHGRQAEKLALAHGQPALAAKIRADLKLIETSANAR